MQLKAYSIFDNKALHYHSPFFMSTHGQAVRALQDLVSDLSTTVGRHPGDYVLYCIGAFDDQKAALLPLSPLEHVCDAISLVKLQQTLPLAAQ